MYVSKVEDLLIAILLGAKKPLIFNILEIDISQHYIRQLIRLRINRYNTVQIISAKHIILELIKYCFAFFFANH
jgi:hypothetical protein